MQNKSIISPSLPSFPNPQQPTPQQSRRKHLNDLLKRFTQLLDPPGYQPNQQTIQQQTKSICNTPLRQLLRKRDRVKTTIEHKMYQRALAYSESKQSEIEFNKQFRLKKKTRVLTETLGSFIDEKETEKFLKQNQFHRNSLLAEIFLEDGSIRENILQKSLLYERFYEQKKEENKLKVQSMVEIPKRFKGTNPKHIRLPHTPRSQVQFKHLKYVQHKKKLQFFEKTLLSQQHDITNKLNTNSNLIELIVNLNQEYAKEKVQTDEDKQLSLVFKRLFLHYSNQQADNPDDLYTNITKQRAIELLKDFKIQTNLIKNQQFTFPLGSFKFQQFIGKISTQLFGCTKFPTRKITKQIFSPMKHKFIHPLMNSLQSLSQQISQYFTNNIKKSFQLKKLFMKITNKTTIDKEDRIVFRQLFQKLWNLKIFPNLIHKSSIRYYFESYNAGADGIGFEEFREFMIVVALHIYKGESMLGGKLGKLFGLVRSYLAKCG